jgi:transcription termination factor NusB
MNERIRELAEQALFESDFDDEQNIKITMDIFAELIVKECRDIVEQDMKLAHIQMIPLTLEKYANGRLKEKIREHFGVEK